MKWCLSFVLVTALSQLSFAQSAKCSDIFYWPDPAKEKNSRTEISQNDNEQLQADADGRFRVLLWNAAGGDSKSWWSEFSKIQLNVQIILLQEVNLSESNKSRYAKDSKRSWMHIANLIWSDGTPKGLLTGINGKISEDKVVLSKYTEPLTGTPKASYLSFVNLNNSKLMIVNTHGINFVTIGSFKEQINSVAKQIQNHSGPVIWAGDFNTWNNDRLIYLKSVAHKLGLSHTAHGANFSILVGVLDHVFSRGLHIIDKKILKESESSDHKPLIVEFQSIN